MAVLRDVVFDCFHPASPARFRAAALDGYEVGPYDDGELERLRREGIEEPEDDSSVLVRPVSGAAPRSFFHKVPEPRSAKNRVHLDLWAEDVEAEAERLVRRGATRTARVEDRVAVADPEGNEFDVLPAE
ncbi:VOC family protein [Nocardiopsis tropica]|uniref:VOC family protein n=1 Tax=Nocardiopsis tropica TaxID=109330 RepID=A0ABV2A207_9ACTN